MPPKIRKSRILFEVHETVSALHRAGLVSKRRMHAYEFLYQLDALALRPGKKLTIGSSAKPS